MAVGSYCVVRAGEQVPLDGVQTTGEALVTTQHITGEALPLRRKAGDQVPAGAQVVEGVLVVRPSRYASVHAALPWCLKALKCEAESDGSRLFKTDVILSWQLPTPSVFFSCLVSLTPWLQRSIGLSSPRIPSLPIPEFQRQAVFLCHVTSGAESTSVAFDGTSSVLRGMV